jgi:hypothetical protein
MFKSMQIGCVGMGADGKVVLKENLQKTRNPREYCVKSGNSGRRVQWQLIDWITKVSTSDIVAIHLREAFKQVIENTEFIKTAD